MHDSQPRVGRGRELRPAEANQVVDVRDETARRATGAWIGLVERARSAACKVWLAEARGLQPERLEDPFGDGVLVRRSCSLRTEQPGQPVPRVGVRPGLLDGQEPPHGSQLGDDAGKRVVTVAEATEIATLRVEAARVREQVADAHVCRPDAGRVLDVEQVESEGGRERLGHGRDPKAGVRVAADSERFDLAVDRGCDCERRNVPGDRGGLANGVKRRIQH